MQIEGRKQKRSSFPQDAFQNRFSVEFHTKINRTSRETVSIDRTRVFDREANESFNARANTNRKQVGKHENGKMVPPSENSRLLFIPHEFYTFSLTCVVHARFHVDSYQLGTEFSTIIRHDRMYTRSQNNNKRGWEVAGQVPARQCRIFSIFRSLSNTISHLSLSPATTLTDFPSTVKFRIQENFQLCISFIRRNPSLPDENIHTLVPGRRLNFRYEHVIEITKNFW